MLDDCLRKSLSTLPQKSATVAENGETTATVAEFGDDSRTFLRQCGQALTLWNWDQHQRTFWVRFREQYYCEVWRCKLGGVWFRFCLFQSQSITSIISFICSNAFIYVAMSRPFSPTSWISARQYSRITLWRLVKLKYDNFARPVSLQILSCVTARLYFILCVVMSIPTQPSDRVVFCFGVGILLLCLIRVLHCPLYW